MANKLHELLAIEQDRKNKANLALGEAVKMFTKSDVVFDGMVKRYIALEEDSEKIPDEIKEMTSTIKERLQNTIEALVSGLDAHISKEETNSANIAKAELSVNGINLGTFSATSLLAMEGQLNKIREMYQAIPILDTTRKWSFDAQKAVYSTEEEVKFRSIKRPKVIVKYEATKEHPAQTELLYLDFQIGKYETVYTSGKITPAQKAILLKRIDELSEAVKIARTKANNVEVNNIKIGQKLFEYINEGIF
jgi:hypothetical protein